MAKIPEDLVGALWRADIAARREFSSQPVGFVMLPCAGDTHWLEIALSDDAGPLDREPYRVVLPDGSIRAGALSAAGHARIDGIAAAGACLVEFPQIPLASGDLEDTPEDPDERLVVYQGDSLPSVSTGAFWHFILPDWEIVSLDVRPAADAGSASGTTCANGADEDDD